MKLETRKTSEMNVRERYEFKQTLINIAGYTKKLNPNINEPIAAFMERLETFIAQNTNIVIDDDAMSHDIACEIAEFLYD